MAESLSARVEREREIYDEGLRRTRYESVLGHAGYQHGLSRTRLAGSFLGRERIDRALELGCRVWDEWLERSGTIPKEMYCINISERELQKGVERVVGRDLRIHPRFMIMDAHQLDFPDGHFDLVCGSGILHHLELDRALDEIERVLRPGGCIMFSEPLDNNPIGWAVRSLTPAARTEDEVPFRSAQLEKIGRRFDCQLHFEQLVSVPLGLISRLLFRSPENGLMRMAFRLDEAISRSVPGLGRYFRKVTITGRKKANAGG